MNGKQDKLWFASDYMEGAHPALMARLSETNMEHCAGYGLDVYSESAREKIRVACETPEADGGFMRRYAAYLKKAQFML